MRKSTQKTEREKDSLVAVGETSAFAGESPRNERVHRESDYETEEQREAVEEGYERNELVPVAVSE